MGFRAGVDAVAKRKISIIASARNWNQSRPARYKL